MLSSDSKNIFSSQNITTFVGKTYPCWGVKIIALLSLNDFLAYPFNNDTKVTNDNVQNVLDASLVIFSIFYMALIWLLVYKNEDNNSI